MFSLNISMHEKFSYCFLLLIELHRLVWNIRFSFYGANSVDLSIENTINCRVFASLITWIDRLMKSVFRYLPTSVASPSANYSDRVVTAGTPYTIAIFDTALFSNICVVFVLRCYRFD